MAAKLVSLSLSFNTNTPDHYRSSDAYHTCYVLSGLSAAQHITVFAPMETNVPNEDVQKADATAQETAAHAGTVGWEVYPDYPEVQVFDEQDRVSPIDPVYTIPLQERADFIRHFKSKSGF